jgi:uncharacterized repeat protein (TIGR01451 family)
MRPALVALVATVGLVLAAEAGPAGNRVASAPVAATLARCPTAAEVAAVNAGLVLEFDPTLSAGPLVCTAAAGSADLNETERRVYAILGVLRGMTFSRPLPWTRLRVYPWLVGAIDGIRFRSDISSSYCCDPANFIDVAVEPGHAFLTLTPLWIDPSGGGGLYDTGVVFVHEARHNEGRPHTCGGGTNDQTVDELGAWGVQYYFGIWAALFSGSYLDAPGGDPALYRESALRHAEGVISTRFCKIPHADLKLTVSASPAPVPAGATLTYTATVTNSGADAVPQAFLYTETPNGAVFSSVSTSRGSCAGPSPGSTGAIGCQLGSVGPGASARVTVRLLATAAAPATITPTGLWTAHVTGTDVDTYPANNSAAISTAVIPAPPCAGTPSAGGVKTIGDRGPNTIAGTSGDDVLCGAGGDDRLRGGAGRDILRGGTGNDVIYARDGGRDLIDCGAGRDVAYVDPSDEVRGCEIIRR